MSNLDDGAERPAPDTPRATARSAQRDGLRVACADDAPALLAIYAPYVRDPAISMESELPEPEAMRQRIEQTLLRHPWLVDVRDGRIAGFAYARPHRERSGWRWCCETAVYVDAAFQRRGVAQRLYRALFTLLRLQNYLHAFAAIMLPNAASVRLHERLGFVHRGTYAQAGHKFGAWYDIGFWQLTLATLPEAAGEPIAFPRLAADAVAIALR